MSILTCFCCVFLGNSGLDIHINTPLSNANSDSKNDNKKKKNNNKKKINYYPVLKLLFNEELGAVLEVHPTHADKIIQQFKRYNIPCMVIGRSRKDMQVNVCMYVHITTHALLRTHTQTAMNDSNFCITHILTQISPGPNCTYTHTSHITQIRVNDVVVMDKKDMRDLRDVWEETSYRLDMLQTNPACARQEYVRMYVCVCMCDDALLVFFLIASVFVCFCM